MDVLAMIIWKRHQCSVTKLGIQWKLHTNITKNTTCISLQTFPTITSCVISLSWKQTSSPHEKTLLDEPNLFFLILCDTSWMFQQIKQQLTCQFMDSRYTSRSTSLFQSLNLSCSALCPATSSHKPTIIGTARSLVFHFPGASLFFHFFPPCCSSHWYFPQCDKWGYFKIQTGFIGEPGDDTF